MSSLKPGVSPSAMAAMKSGSVAVVVATAATAVALADAAFVENYISDDAGKFFSFDVATGKFTTLKKIRRLKVSQVLTGVLGGAGDVIIMEVHKDGTAAGSCRAIIGDTIVEQTGTLVDVLTNVAKGSTISVMYTATANDDQITVSDANLLLEVLEVDGVG